MRAMGEQSDHPPKHTRHRLEGGGWSEFGRSIIFESRDSLENPPGRTGTDPLAVLCWMRGHHDGR